MITPTLADLEPSLFASQAGPNFLLLPLIGMLAGMLGGMLGVGGGLIMIPMLVLILHQPFGRDSLHVFKLASLISSVALSLPAARRHAQVRALSLAMVRAFLPLAMVGVVVGTALAALLTSEYTPVLQRIFGGFLIVVVLFNLLRDFGPSLLRDVRATACPTPARWLLLGGSVGLPSGLVAGLLGVGGGIWAVPVQHQLFGIRLQNAIANSTAMIVGVAFAASVTQAYTLARLPGVSPWSGVWLAMWLAPGAILGGPIGAWLVHRLPGAWLRQAFQLLLALAGAELLRR